MLEVPGGKFISMETHILPESKSSIELTAAVEELTTLRSSSEDLFAEWSETQDKEPGLPLTAEPEETSLRFKVLQDNISTSVVSEHGELVLEEDNQLNQREDQFQLDSTNNLLSNLLTGETEELKPGIHSRPTDSMLDGDKVLSPVLTLWMMLEVPGGWSISEVHHWSLESKSWTELTAAVEESTTLRSSSEELFAEWSETQDKEPGLPLTAEPEVALLRLLVLQDNISTSVVLEPGDTWEEVEKLDQEENNKLFSSTNNLLSNPLTGEMEESRLIIHSRLVTSMPDGDKVLSHAPILWMMLEVPGG